jgi:hypothetical protein
VVRSERQTSAAAVELKYDGGADYAAKVDAVKQSLVAKPALGTLEALGELYNQVREEKEEIEAVLSDVALQLEAINQLVIERMQDQGLSSLKLAAGGSFIIADKPQVSTEDKSKVREWFKKNGLEEMLSVHPSTLTSFVSGILEDPIDPTTGNPKATPDGIKVYMRTTLSRRKK